MDKFKELLTKLQENAGKQNNCWEESIPEEIWDNYFMKFDYKILKSDIDRDEHRWYVISTIVVEILDGLLGIRAVTDLLSETMDYESCYHTLEFFEMKEINVISYKKK